MYRSSLFLALLISIACPNASGQYVEPVTDRVYSAVHQPLIMPADRTSIAGPPVVPLATRGDQGSLALTIGSSALLGTAGFFVGGFVGSALADDCAYFDCIEPVIFGVLLGTPVGTAVGAHIGNGRRGSLGYDLLAGLGGSAAGMLILAVDSDSAIPVLLAGASVVALPVLVERRTAGRRARARRVAVTAAPMSNGFHVGLRVTMGG